MKPMILTFVMIFAMLARADTPSTQPARGSTLTVSAVIDAPADEIFNSLTTGEGFRRAMGVASAKVDFRIGGQIRSAYKAETDLDSDAAIINTILSYEPGRMLSIKPTAPAGSPDWLVAICQSGFNVIRLDPIGPEQTRVTITGMGFGEGALFDTAYKFFKQGNESTLKAMQQNLGRSGVQQQSQRAFELMKSRLGPGEATAEWRLDQKLPDGRTLRGRTIWAPEAGGIFLRVSGDLGDEKALRPHGVFLCGIDAQAQSFFVHGMDSGALVRGGLKALDDGKTVAADWNVLLPDGTSATWLIHFGFPDADHYTMKLWKSAAAVGEPAINVLYERVTATAAKSE